MIMLNGLTRDLLCACVLGHLVAIAAFGLPLGALLAVHKEIFILAASLQRLFEGCTLVASRNALWLRFLVVGAIDEVVV